MQVYLPFKDFRKCVSVMDTETLKRQRDNAKNLLLAILWKKGDFNPVKQFQKTYEKIHEHPIFILWFNHGKPFCNSLLRYLDSCNFELFNRGFEIEKYQWLHKNMILNHAKYHNGSPPTPKRITTGYRIILLCFNEDYYKNIFFATYKKNIDLINKLKNSKERFRFSKFLGLRLQ
jgi:hypothetical protein